MPRNENGRYILCLEQVWSPKESLSVQPFLETMRMADKIQYTHRLVRSERDIEFFLSEPYGGMGILYFAMHGRRGGLRMGNIGLKRLAEMMGTRFWGWYLHLSACEALNIPDTAIDTLKKETGISLISGYVKQVDWMTSLAVDTLLLRKSQMYKTPSSLIKHMYGNHEGTMLDSGLYIK